MSAPDLPTPYPAVPREEQTVDVLHGRRVPDPYRWLEDPEDERTRAFVAAQNAISRPYLAALPGRDRLLELTRRLVRVPGMSAPVRRGRELFALVADGIANQPRLAVADGPRQLAQAPRILLDPNPESEDGATAITSFRVSRDGALIAAAVSEGGSDWASVRILETASGRERDERIPWTKFMPPVWLPDGRSLLYAAYDAPEAGAEHAQRQGAVRIMRHVLGTPVAEDRIVFHEPDEPERHLYVEAYREWLVRIDLRAGAEQTALSAHRLVPGSDGALEPEAAGVPLVEPFTEIAWPCAEQDGRILLLSDRDAPRRRLDAVRPGEGPGGRTTLVPEHPQDTLLEAAHAASGLFLRYLAVTRERLQAFGFDGAPGPEAPIGELVSLAHLAAEPEHAEAYAVVEGFTEPGRVLEVRADGEAVERWAPGTGRLAGVRVLHRHATSPDGTRVPYTVLGHGEPGADGPRATLVYGYGGFDVPLTPSFHPLFAAWLAAGGTLAIANLRGGGEFGTAWHEAGTKLRKQNVFDDFVAVACELARTGVSAPGRMVAHGRSNGGLLAAAAMLQRPELWAASLPTVGVLDMLRYHLFTIGWAWAGDYGTVEDPAQFEALYAYSPLHNVRAGVAYPPTLVSTGDHDDRVVPAHSYKFVAELQHRAGPEAGPFLLRVDTRAGHGAGKPKDALAVEYAEQLAFAAHHADLAVAETELASISASASASRGPRGGGDGDGTGR